MKLIYVEWLDSCATGSEWEFKEDIKDMKPNNCETVGFLFSKTKEYIIVIQSHGGIGEEREQLLGRICIPKGCIKSMREVK